MTYSLQKVSKTPLRRLKQTAYQLRDIAARAYGQPSAGMITSLRRDDKRVIFIHNPKTAGSSLGMYLGVKKRTHTFPSDRLNTKAWLSNFSIVAVRDPFDRFLSGYFDHVSKPNANALTRMYGPRLKRATPFQYLEIVLANPKFGGPQINWTDFPCALKPRADLVLRFEEINLWPQQITAAGVNIECRQMTYRNTGLYAHSEPAKALGLTEKEYRELESAVRRAYLADAVAFGYPLK